MSNLPNFENAIIPNDKIFDYCLNEKHERGKHKARVFKSVFGIEVENGEILKVAILEQMSISKFTEIAESKFGIKYTVPMEITIFGISHEVITAWIIDLNSDFPRLTSCYVNI